MSLLDIINLKKEEPILLENNFNDYIQSEKVNILNYFNSISQDNLILNENEISPESIINKTFKMEISTPSLNIEKIVLIFNDDGENIDVKFIDNKFNTVIAEINIAELSIVPKNLKVCNYDKLKEIINYIITQ